MFCTLQRLVILFKVKKGFLPIMLVVTKSQKKKNFQTFPPFPFYKKITSIKQIRAHSRTEGPGSSPGFMLHVQSRAKRSEGRRAAAGTHGQGVLGLHQWVPTSSLPLGGTCQPLIPTTKPSLGERCDVIRTIPAPSVQPAGIKTRTYCTEHALGQR